MKKEARNLEEACNGDFQKIIQGEIYCSIALIKKINCSYQDKDKDENDMYRCLRYIIKKEESTFSGMKERCSKFEAIMDGCDNLFFDDKCYSCNGDDSHDCYTPSLFKRFRSSIFSGENE